MIRVQLSLLRSPGRHVRIQKLERQPPAHWERAKVLTYLTEDEPFTGIITQAREAYELIEPDRQSEPGTTRIMVEPDLGSMPLGHALAIRRAVLLDGRWVHDPHPLTLSRSTTMHRTDILIAPTVAWTIYEVVPRVLEDPNTAPPIEATV